MATLLTRLYESDQNSNSPVVTDYAAEYAEPEYSNDGKGPIVFGNWNQRGGWGQDNPSKADRYPVRLGDALEWVGCTLEWSDEWTTCSECCRALRTQGDSYHWTLYGAFTEGGYTCKDCMQEDPGAYLDEYLNNSDTAITWLSGSDLEALGFEQYAPGDPQTYENGYHPGQTDEPATVLKAIASDEGDFPGADVVFLIDEVSQFYLKFSAYYRIDTEEG